MSTRVIPCLLLHGSGLVKTTKFKDPKYLGDPRNAVRIFNEKEVDELILLDIGATAERRPPQYALLEEIVSEAFMPVAYGGGIRSIDDIRRINGIGVEKVVIGSQACENPSLIEQAASLFGSSTIVVCMDVKRRLLGRYDVCVNNGRTAMNIEPVAFARRMESLGAGELVVNAIDRDGTMNGYDIHLLRSIADAVSTPVIACGGAGELSHLSDAVRNGHVSAVAAGSMFVFSGKHRAVLINFPSQRELQEVLAR